MTVLLPRSSDTVLDTGMQYYVQNNTKYRLVTGDGKTDLLRWNRIAYRCEANQRIIVPWPVIALYFGDPRSQHGKLVEAEDSQGSHIIPSRGSELLRLSVFYGVYEQGVDEISAVVPDVTISTLDGKEIVPPCFDPDGNNIYGYQRSMQRSSDVSTIIDDLQAQIDALREGQSKMVETGDNDSPIPEDNPHLP